jgi:hypothetical protein
VWLPAALCDSEVQLLPISEGRQTQGCRSCSLVPPTCFQLRAKQVKYAKAADVKLLMLRMGSQALLLTHSSMTRR